MSSLISFVYELIHSKLYPPVNPIISFATKAVLVTGANSGLGFEAALKFTSLGASTVILATRSISKGEAAAAEIERRTGRTGVLRVWHLDMNSYESVRGLAKRAANELERLDVAVLNAGVVQMRHRVSAEGWEETLQVNVLSTVLLGILLLPIMRSAIKEGHADISAPPHLCFVSSGNYASATLSPAARTSPNLLAHCSQRESFAGPEPQYSISKLFLTYAVNSLAAREADSKCGRVVINSVNPGATATNLTRDIDGLALRVLAWVYTRLLARTAEQGSRSLVSACALGEESMGGYWTNDRVEA